MCVHRGMLLSIIVVLLVIETQCTTKFTLSLTATTNMRHNKAGVAKFFDAEHRGAHFYSYTSASETSDSREPPVSSIEIRPDTTSTSSESTEASSVRTSQEKRRYHEMTHRKCKGCPKDMLKEYINRGIKWICGTYQRARRSFKSECMMRFRNCQDGTMFIKSADHRCRDNEFHGRHWFYDYKV